MRNISTTIRLVTILVVITICLSAKRNPSKLLRRQEIDSGNNAAQGNPPQREEDRDEGNRNVTKLYDAVHKYEGKARKLRSGARRHYLGEFNTLQGILSNTRNRNGLNGLSTGEIGAEADDPNASYLDATHGVTASLHAQKLQVGTQPDAAHPPSEDGLSPLPYYNRRKKQHILADHSVPSPIKVGHHFDAAVEHVAVDHSVAAPPTSMVGNGGALGHHGDLDHFTTNVGSDAANQHVVLDQHQHGILDQHQHGILDQHQHGILDQHQHGILDQHQPAVLNQLQHLESTNLANHVHAADMSLFANHIPDQSHGVQDIAGVQAAEGSHIDTSLLGGADIGHATAGHHLDADYTGGAEVQHALADQTPYEITKPPIHVGKIHHHTSYEEVQDEGEVKYHPCVNGGVFVSTGRHSYECICPEKFIGKNCQDVNHCNPCPCKNKGRCHNIVDLPKFKCTCLPGFYGPQCENKNPCHPNPCKNDGVCSHDGKGNIECVCPKRFKGDKCDDLHNCQPNPCQNDGSCVELEGNGKFECQCTNQWRGTVCNKARFCYENPCLNGGICQEGQDTFSCICTHGWRGKTCNDRACKPNPCKNSGTCSEVEDGKAFKCVCLPWHSGPLCEENRPCLTNPCLNGGKCIDSYSGYHWAYGPLQFYCLCKPPYQGERCELHGCRHCHKNAHCEVDKCVCDDGYKGDGRFCIKKEDPCHPNPCENDGICVQVEDTAEYSCQCKKPYLPPNCKLRDPCNPSPCKNDAVCSANGDGSYTCTCPAGTKGVDCETTDPCIPNPCQHSGTCQDNNGTATCECKGFWSKPFCKECSCPKKEMPGIPDVTCDPDGKCVCPTGWSLDSMLKICKKDKGGGGDGCQDKPCVNGGVCSPVGEKDYTCKCQNGYVGKNCQHKDACNPNPCKNGGTCLADKANPSKFLGCTCPKGFSVQPFCDKDKGGGGDNNNPCEPNPCKNEGQCVKKGKSYDCICIVRFTGPQCNVDRCANCDEKNAECINGRCKCKKGFIGNGYECIQDVPTCSQKCPKLSSCVIPTGNCQCNQGYTFVDMVCLPMADDSEEETTTTDGDETTDVKTTARPTDATVTQPATTNAPVTTAISPTTPIGGGGGPVAPTTKPSGPATPALHPMPTTAKPTEAPSMPAKPPSSGSSTGTEKPGAPATSGGSSGSPSPPPPPPPSGGSSGSSGPPGTSEKKPSSSGSSGSSGSPGTSEKKPSSSGSSGSSGSPATSEKKPPSSSGSSGSPSPPPPPPPSSGSSGSSGSPATSEKKPPSSSGSSGSPSPPPPPPPSSGSSGSSGSPGTSEGSSGSPATSEGSSGSPSGPASSSGGPAGPPGPPGSSGKRSIHLKKLKGLSKLHGNNREAPEFGLYRR